jgi:hypothetical protein
MAIRIGHIILQYILLYWNNGTAFWSSKAHQLILLVVERNCDRFGTKMCLGAGDIGCLFGPYFDIRSSLPFSSFSIGLIICWTYLRL